MPYGYTGRILRVDLGEGKIRVEEPDAKLYRSQLGGHGFVSYYLLKELEPGIDPLGPDNLLIFALGVVTGVPIPGSGRHTVGAKSPLSGGFGNSEAGGFWGAELKRAGFDAVLIKGASDKPVYLWIHDGQAEIKNAAHLWGQNTKEAEEMIRDELGDSKVRVAQIGPGGENQVLYASVTHSLVHFAGRGGLGAVMGSKKLKAVAVRGRQAPEIADRARLGELRKWFAENWPETWRANLSEYGTAVNVTGCDTIGNLPTDNFVEGSFAGAAKITGEVMAEEILVDRDTCYACPIVCKRVVQVEGPHSVDRAYGGPEYETLGSLGSACGVDDLRAIAKGNELCNAYTLDTISTGMTIAFAMECFENGLLTLEDTGGIDLRFGNAEAMLRMIELIAHREGIGELLALGSRKAAQQIGRGAEQYAMHAKGVEFPMHEPRVKQGMGLGYAVSSIGADHMQGLQDHSYVNRAPTNLGILETLPMHDLGPIKVRMLVYRQCWWGSLNCLVICDHCDLYDPARGAQLLAAVTGWDTNAWELMKIGERSLTMARAFNLREGFTKEDDWLPDRVFEPHPNSPPWDIAMSRKDLSQAIDLYYGMMGWNAEGVPTDAKLHELGISWVIDELEKAPLRR